MSTFTAEKHTHEYLKTIYKTLFYSEICYKILFIREIKKAAITPP